MSSDTVLCECCGERPAVHVCEKAAHMFLCDDCNAAIVAHVEAT